MKSARVSSLMASAMATLLFVAAPLRADDSNPPSLVGVHQLLRQAAGDSDDTAPPPDQQKALVGQAIKMIRQLPHIYHGELRAATVDLEAALNELAAGDAAPKARSDILEADDLIRTIM